MVREVERLIRGLGEGGGMEGLYKLTGGGEGRVVDRVVGRYGIGGCGFHVVVFFGDFFEACVS